MLPLALILKYSLFIDFVIKVLLHYNRIIWLNIPGFPFEISGSSANDVKDIKDIATKVNVHEGAQHRPRNRLILASGRILKTGVILAHAEIADVAALGKSIVARSPVPDSAPASLALHML